VTRAARLPAFVVLLALVFACGGPDAAVRARLRDARPLTREEIAQTLAGVNRAMGGRVPLLRQGAVTRQMDEKERNAVFNVLADARDLEDAGPKAVGGLQMRGLRAPATSPQSEIEAMATVWIDTGTLLPRLYEYAYAMPGFGDFTYDLTFESPR
jgi:hypothetical protein